MNSLGNYLAKSWIPQKGCLSCQENKINFKNNKKPHILIGIFIFHPTPFIDQFFNNIEHFNYPKESISLYIYNAPEFHQSDVQEFLDRTKGKYNKVNIMKSKDKMEWEIRNIAL